MDIRNVTDSSKYIERAMWPGSGKFLAIILSRGIGDNDCVPTNRRRLLNVKTPLKGVTAR